MKFKLRHEALGIFILQLFCQLSCSQSFASLGRPVEVESIPDAICRLDIRPQNGDPIFHCTGSVVGENLIKTAGHCLQNTSVEKVVCGDAKELEVVKSERFPLYRHELIQREEFNRWQDHALIEVKNLDVKAFSVVTSEFEYHQLRPLFEECLMAGFGFQEELSLKTGHLKGVSFDPNFLSIQDGLLYAKGAYFFELMPGDSGGPLLCYADEQWYDLGVASAHDWDHQSIYAPNFKVSSWYNQYNLNQDKTPSRRSSLSLSFQQIYRVDDIQIGKKYMLKAYSEFLSQEGVHHNGDLNSLEMLVTEVTDNGQVTGHVFVDQVSSFFMCFDSFLCYGTDFLLTTSIENLQ